MRSLGSFVVAVAFTTAVPCGADARTLRWSSQADYHSADPMAANEGLTNTINAHVYEFLVIRGRKLEVLPGLAVSWRQTSPTTWVFDLRKGVKWHDGSDFTAEDVVFSVHRIHHDEVHHIPLHHQMIPWAARANVEVVHRANNELRATWVTIK